MSDYGIKVSKVGQDTGTATDRNLQFTSKYSGLKLFTAGTTSIVKSGTAAVYGTVSHNLGFQPAFFVWRKYTATNSNFGTASYSNAYSPIGNPNTWTPESYLTESIQAYTTSSDLIIAINTGTTTGTYDFKYYYLVDKANDYSGTMAEITPSDYGFKVSKPGIDVLTAKEYELVYSSKYKALQYYDESFATSAVTLPLQFSSIVDNDVQSGSYVDFYHGLGYAPFYLAYYNSSLSGQLTEMPYFETDDTGIYMKEASSFCNSSFVRLSFYRETHRNSISGALGSIPSEVASFKLYVFTEDLSKGSL
jgi:hypothetical protein